MNLLETRLQSRMDRRDVVQSKHEALLAERGEGELNDTDKSQIGLYREELSSIDSEVAELASDLEAHNKAIETSKSLRRAMIGAIDGIDEEGEGVVYRTMAAYARDVILARESTVCSQIGKQFGDPVTVESARSRLQLLQRTPANTLSSNVAGLQPPQFIDQIFQVINKSRPLVDSAKSSTLERGVLTFPKVTQRPVVAVQATEKTEAGNQGMIVTMQQTPAQTFLGGGDLSWQAINWSTPDALQLWFDLAAADYALKTETAAAQVMEDSAANHVIADVLAGSSADTFADWLVALTEGAALVYANSGRLSDTVYVAPGMFYLAAALTSNAFAQTIAAGRLNLGAQNGDIAGLNVVVSRGLHTGVSIVGDSQGLLVAETAGAPVELRVVEPAIGGLEVGIIGAFAPVVVDDGAFALISTNS